MAWIPGAPEILDRAFLSLEIHRYERLSDASYDSSMEIDLRPDWMAAGYRVDPGLHYQALADLRFQGRGGQKLTVAFAADDRFPGFFVVHPHYEPDSQMSWDHNLNHRRSARMPLPPSTPASILRIFDRLDRLIQGDAFRPSRPPARSP